MKIAAAYTLIKRMNKGERNESFEKSGPGELFCIYMIFLDITFVGFSYDILLKYLFNSLILSINAFSMNLHIEKCHYVQLEIFLNENHAVVSAKSGNTKENQKDHLYFFKFMCNTDEIKKICHFSIPTSAIKFIPSTFHALECFTRISSLIQIYLTLPF